MGILQCQSCYLKNINFTFPFSCRAFGQLSFTEEKTRCCGKK